MRGESPFAGVVTGVVCGGSVVPGENIEQLGTLGDTFSRGHAGVGQEQALHFQVDQGTWRICTYVSSFYCD